MDVQPRTLNDILRRRALHQPERLAYTYLPDGIEEKERVTYGGLDVLARGVAARLQSLGARGERALLLYPAGVDFIAAFFGCLYGGCIAVPAYPPHPARPHITLPRLQSILDDSRAKFVLTTSTILSRVEPLFAASEGLRQPLWLATDELAGAHADEWSEPGVSGQDLAFLQYTSGSTSAPKGVMVSHRNLLANSEEIRRGFGHTPESVGVTWLPAYHDMGLIDGLIQPLFTGFPCYLMPPAAFLQRPARWLQAVSRYRATHTGAPNFAYELCARKVSPEQRAALDLSCVEVAYNGAEPVREETLRRFAEAFEPCGFRRQAFYPTYGLAEATLKVSGGGREAMPVTCTVDAAALEQNRVVETSGATPEQNVRTLVGVGGPATETRIVFVEPSTLKPCADGEVGELWVAGPGVAGGYWNRPELTEETFRARLADTGEGPFLRTGDLGFVKDGELFITGRLKDLIIIGGRNHYPQDIELTVEQSHPALRPGCIAAFSVAVEGEEQLVIAAEVDPRYRPAAAHEPPPESATVPGLSLDVKSLTRTMRAAVSDCYGLQVSALALLKLGGMPKTSSGKIRRHACRQSYLAGSLECLAAG